MLFNLNVIWSKESIEGQNTLRKVEDGDRGYYILTRYTRVSKKVLVAVFTEHGYLKA